MAFNAIIHRVFTYTDRASNAIIHHIFTYTDRTNPVPTLSSSVIFRNLPQSFNKNSLAFSPKTPTLYISKIRHLFFPQKDEKQH
jgi:hypothetical protein